MFFDLPPSYSSHIRLQLETEDQIYDLSRVQTDRVYLREGAEIAKGDASVLIFVDGVCRKSAVKILHDTAPFDEEVLIEIR